MRARSIACVILALIALASTWAVNEIDPFTPPEGRSLAMGGVHAALADDYYVLLSNPAGIAVAPKQLLVSQLGFDAAGPLFDFANMAVAGGDLTASLQQLFAKNNYRIYSGFTMPGPVSFGYIDHGLGFGVFNTTGFVLNMASASSIKVNLREDFLLTGGYALRFDLGKGHSLDAGVGAKGFVRGESADTYDVLGLSSLLSSPTQIFAAPYTMSTGIGLDMGLRWAYDEVVAAGLAWRDVYSPAFISTYSGGIMDFLNSTGAAPSTSYAVIHPNLDFGLMWKPKLGRLGQVLDSLEFAMDYSDVLDLLSLLPRNAILNVSFGVETRVLDILYIRAGIRDALLSAGVGLDLNVFTLNIAAYGEELGLEPGTRPVYNLLMSLEFRY
ncbi:MAG TPA: hypothetical protein VMC79_14520 [Rectinemataceae bacterium]|nr:hypothetical protein [Rectinemataceae bacterium]